MDGLAKISVDISTAQKKWSDAFNFFLQYKSFESLHNYSTVFGRLNFYLFIYLPLWLSNNPSSKFLYPFAPNLFRGMVHYKCDLVKSNNRPLSFVEFLIEIGWKLSFGTLDPLRVFFKVLIALPMVPGCEGIVQPIYWLPKSKKYDRVVKQIFPGEQLLLFVDFLYALESISEWAEENELKFREEYEVSKKENRLFKFSNVGYVPVLLIDGKYRAIEFVHPLIFVYFDFGGKTYFNPGATRFSIFMLEVGVRAQTAQWLCSTTYNLVSYMESKHPLQLVSLWLNTDKISKVPLVVITIMQILWLLDAQVKWRDNLISKGVAGLGKRVYYEKNKKSKWGLISPIFAHNPRTGMPFSDNSYAEFWAYQCFSFQSWMATLNVKMPNIVAFLPFKNDGGFITWDEFQSGLSGSDVKINKGSPNGRVYVGDYCPVSLRCKVTPHGARASFITSMSVALCPEAIVLLTGQTAGTVRQYNKGDYLLRRKIQGAYNSKDAIGTLNGERRKISLDRVLKDIDEELRADEPLELSRFGLLSPDFKALGYGEDKSSNVIASDSRSRMRSTYSHICTRGFNCPSEILKEFDGVMICPACPYAVFSIFHLPEVAAARQKAAEDFEHLSNAVEKRRTGRGSLKEDLSLLTVQLNQKARLAVSWLVLEEALWCQIQIAKKDSSCTSDLIAIDRTMALKEIERYEVKKDSVEFFINRLAEVCMFEDSLSTEFQFKIERAVRMLLVHDERLLEAALMPVGFSTSTELASMLKAKIGFADFDVEEFVTLINMSHDDWRQRLSLEYDKKIFLDRDA